MKKKNFCKYLIKLLYLLLNPLVSEIAQFMKSRYIYGVVYH